MALSPILDRWGRPMEKAVLTTEIAAATVGGVRSPLTGYPGDGLNPERLAQILREADQGDPLRYLELAQTIEERDLHYVGVLGTRKRSVSQLEITVEAASDSPEHQAHAETVREWLKRDELQDEIFNMLDAIGKGYSLTEIMWDTSEGQWMPGRLEYRDPRWFRPARADLATPMLISANGQEEPLPPFKFIHPVMRAKSGLPVRSGLARIVFWAWLFKALSNRDWAIFTQTYGQPVRIGKYGPGATNEEKDTLFRAVAGIAGDCAAIIPNSMVIDFIESKSVGASSDLYEKRITHLDQQVSKAVLGQTATTDAVTGGLGSGKEHRQVQEDIERADAKELAATLNRDLIRPWIALEFSDHGGKFPRLKIGRSEQTDVKLTVESVKQLVPLGLKVGKNQMREIIGLGKPADDDELLAEAVEPPPAVITPGASPGATPTLHAVQPLRPEDKITADALASAAKPTAALIDTIRAMIDQANTMDEVKAMLVAASPDLGVADLALAMRQALIVAQLAGRAEMLDG